MHGVSVAGSSPRVWGTPWRVCRMTEFSRFIPTGVGNAEFTSAFMSAFTVHPHGCGERTGSDTNPGYATGSSPRVWGTHLKPRLPPTGARFIPTGVGNAAGDIDLGIMGPVHPHGCGERQFRQSAIFYAHGSSPRVWGTRGLEGTHSAGSRFIPTGVGNAIESDSRLYRDAVHPHGCGERKLDGRFSCSTTGSSPRVWGTHRRFFERVSPDRFIPTGVGNALERYPFHSRRSVHPHGCGERTASKGAPVTKGGSSPRVWGTLSPYRDHCRDSRFIPTGVGNAFRLRAGALSGPVHPHGCGERCSPLNRLIS